MAGTGDGRSEGRKDGKTEGRKDGRTERRKDGKTEGRKGGKSESRKGGRGSRGHLHANFRRGKALARRRRTGSRITAGTEFSSIDHAPIAAASFVVLRPPPSNAGSTNSAPRVPASVPPVVASAMAPNRLSDSVPMANGRRLASVVSVTSTIIPDRSSAASTTSCTASLVPRAPPPVLRALRSSAASTIRIAW